MEDSALNNRGIKIAITKKLNEIQERQFNELRNKVNEQKEYFTKETETMKKN